MDTPLYIRVRGRVLGPYDQEKLQQLARRGQLSRMHEVSTDGANWVRASVYAELFVGDPVRLVAPEMPVRPAPAIPQQEVLEAIACAVEPAPLQTRPAMASQAGRDWYYESHGKETGPIDESGLKQLIAIGQVTLETCVWCEGMKQWTVAGQVPGLVPAAALPTPVHYGGDNSTASDSLTESLCKAASDSRPWAIFLAITAFVYAGLLMLTGFFMLIGGADKGNPFVVVMGFSWIVNSIVAAIGGILLIGYANRLASLNYSKSSRILESALVKLKTFWMYISIVLIVILAFVGFLVLWGVAIGSSLARYT